MAAQSGVLRPVQLPRASLRSQTGTNVPTRLTLGVSSTAFRGVRLHSSRRANASRALRNSAVPVHAAIMDAPPSSAPGKEDKKPQNDANVSGLVGNWYEKLPVYSGTQGPKKTDRARVLVVGSGWGAMSFIKALPKHVSENYDITIVSPRNYFLYTPLLPAVATGTVEDRSIVEPVRKVVKDKARYFEAEVKEIDPESRTVVACFPKDAQLDEACFKIPYDILILGVGSINNTFGTKGVQEHTQFFKTVEDAKELRRQVSECFERAALPATPKEERQKLLSFVVIGGGPTGIEVAAELYDMVQQDLRKVYPDIVNDVMVRVIELQDHILSTYDRAISTYAGELFTRNGIQLVLNTKVQAVNKGSVSVVDKAGKTTEIPFGAAVWATGVAMHPLIKQLQSKLPGQSHFRSILTDEHLCVKGSGGTIYALGDAATIDQAKALEHADRLFTKADVNGDGKLQMSELRALMRDASKEYSHLQEHARFLDSKYGTMRFSGLVAETLAGFGKGKNKGKAAAAAAKPSSGEAGALQDLAEHSELSPDEFKQLLSKIDQGLRALPATAQVAKQQGEYMAKLFKAGVRPGETPPHAPFNYSHKGSLAYVGSDKAVMDVPNLGPITGAGAGFLWKGYETYSQISLRNVFLVGLDWLRTKLFGRDISRF